MNIQCNSKTLHGSLILPFCIFKQIGYHMSRAMKSVILQQFDSRMRAVRCAGSLARCLVKMQHLKQIIQTVQLLSLIHI